ncbi:succinylglutamate desuccinylase [Catenovulum agarivorans DS-2]|uniref:Succinylglutamate desuccinylase n=1 Tax=Catenovulum agarivorans DS-2 TaxID=1328313 RepID=W7R071_9ALTE|nr:succinylglutamate desuccinylase [Catenovulum agarivorans]EWH11010.1 succinylglutamate desuccinylase [Catenovulum agarivorans DS-2]
MHSLLQEYLANLISKSDSVFKPICFQLSCGTWVWQHAAGILEFIPARYFEHSVILTAGVHGDETAPIEVLDQVIRDIAHNELKLQYHLVVVFANPQAIRQGIRFVDTNLNRLFASAYNSQSDGPPLGLDNYEYRRAAQLKQALHVIFARTAFTHRIHLDLHCSIKPSIYPVFAVKPYTEVGRAPVIYNCPIVYPVEALIHSRRASATLSYYTTNYLAANAATVELGQAAPLYKNPPAMLKSIYSNIRVQLAQNFSQPRFCILSDKHFVVKAEIIKQKLDFRFAADLQFNNFHPIASDRIIAYQTRFQPIFAKANQRICFANQAVEVGHRAALIVEKLA